MTLADVLLQFIPYNPLPRYLTEYEPGVTPLSDTTPVVATLIAYLVTIFSIRWFMQDKAPLKLTLFFQSHNLFLTLISGLLLVLIGEEILPIWWRTGSFDAICHPRSWTEVLLSLRMLCGLLLLLMVPQQRLEFYYMVNYYIKYLELIDTVFLALKKKPLGPLFFGYITPRRATDHAFAWHRSLLACFPSLGYCFTLLYPTQWKNGCSERTIPLCSPMSGYSEILTMC